jgi:hypothetical protein
MKLKRFCTTTTKKWSPDWRGSPQNKRKSLPAIHLIRDWKLEHIGSSKKTKLSKKSMTQWRNEQMNRTEVFQRRKSKWLKTTWRNVQPFWP